MPQLATRTVPPWVPTAVGRSWAAAGTSQISPIKRQNFSPPDAAAHTAKAAAFAPSHAGPAPPCAVSRPSGEERNGVLPHPGPPQLGTETWRVFKQPRRAQKERAVPTPGDSGTQWR